MERKDEVVVVRAMVGAFEALAELAAWLRSLDGVQRAKTSCWMNRQERVDEYQITVGRGDGLGIQWYAVARLASGRDLSFELELCWDNGGWVVEARISTVGSQGWDSLVELPPRTAESADAVAVELDRQNRLLVDRRDEVLRLLAELGPK